MGGTGGSSRSQNMVMTVLPGTNPTTARGPGAARLLFVGPNPDHKCDENHLRDIFNFNPLAPREPLDLRRAGRRMLGRMLGRQLVLGRARLKLVELKLQLVEKPLLALRAPAVHLSSYYPLVTCLRC